MPEITNDELDEYFGNYRANILAPSLRAETPQRFDAVKEQQQEDEAAAQEDYRANTTVGERALKSAKGALSTAAAVGAITNEVKNRKELYDEGGIIDAILQDPLKDPDWSFEENEESRATINSVIDELRLDPESSDARRLRNSRSYREMYQTVERVREKIDHAEHVKNSGVFTGEVAAIAGSLIDLDLVVAGPIFKSLSIGAKATKVQKGLAELPRLNNLYDGARAGFIASGINETTRAALGDSSADELLGAVAFSTLFGAGIGGVLPVKKGNDFVEWTAGKDVARKAHDFIRRHPTVTNFRDSMAFTSKWEGGMANVQGDRGGRTAYGISEKNFPKHYAKMVQIMESKGEGAAKQFRDDFFKKEFYDKVVTPDMSSGQAAAMFDIAITSGPGTAKKLWKQSGGDLNKLVDAREQFFKDIVKNDPTQAKFLEGWLNRNNDFRETIGNKDTSISQSELPTEALDEISTPTTPETFQATQTPAERLREALDSDLGDELVNDNVKAGVGADANAINPEVQLGAKSKEILDYVYGEFSGNRELTDQANSYFDFVDPNRSPAVQTWQKGVQRVYDAMDYARVLPDHDKAMRTNNAPLQFLTMKLTNSPLGLTAMQTGDNIATRMEDSFKAQYSPFYEENFYAWADKQGYGAVKKRTTIEGERKFGSEVQRELNARRYGENYTDDPHILKAADEYGSTTALMLDELKAAKVEGFEEIPHDPGYFQVRHNKNKFLEWEDRVGTSDMVQSYKQGILRHNQRTGGDVTEPEAFTWATAIVRHARDRQGVSPMSSLQNIGTEGREILEEALRRNNVPETEITKQVDKMLYQSAPLEEQLFDNLSKKGIQDRELAIKLASLTKDERVKLLEAEGIDLSVLNVGSEKGTNKRSRRRIGVDYSSPIKGSNGEGTLFDLIDEDVFGALDSLSRGHAGEIGRVRGTDGLIQKRDIPSWLDAVKDDARTRGVVPDRDVKIAEDILSQFDAGAFSGGLDANVARINRATTLSFMAQLGLPQLAETGVTVSKAGISGFQKHIGESVQAFLKKQPKELVDSLAVSGRYYRPDELQGRRLNLDEVSFGDAGTVGKIVDAGLDKGERFMGEVSLFYRLTGAQQTMSLQVNNQLLFDVINSPKVSKARMTALGINDEVKSIAQKYNKFVERDADGAIIDNHFEKWSLDDANRWRDVIRMNVDYDVQQTRRGFGHAITHKDNLAAMSLKLKSFAMNAFFSKMLRNAKLADRMAAAEMVYNIGFSALAVGAATTVNGQWDRMDADAFAKRTLNWSAHISPGLMLTDPISYMTGLDYIGDNGSSGGLQRYRGHGDGLLGLAPPIAAINNMAGLGRTVGSLLDDGDLERDNINSLKSIPVVGRMYGVPLLLEKLYE